MVTILFYESDNADADTSAFEYLVFFEVFWNFRRRAIYDIAKQPGLRKH